MADNRAPALLLAVLSAACGDECSFGSDWFNVAATPPPPSLAGVWEGHEAPFRTDNVAPWWWFEMDHDATRGTFATDRPIHQGFLGGDTLRGSFRGVVCLATDEIDLQFELRYPRSSNPDDPSYRGKQCTLSGKFIPAYRIDGLVGCSIDEYTTYWSAIRLVSEQYQEY